MASPPKMSLYSQYDDLCRYTKVLTEGCEQEFITFVMEQQRKCKEYEAEIEALKKQTAADQIQIETLESERKKFECQIKHMKNLLDADVARRKDLEDQISSLTRQITLIKEVVATEGTAIDNQTREKLVILSVTTCKQTGDTQTKLTTIEESAGSCLSSVDFDDTDEELDGESHCPRPRSGQQNSGGLNWKHTKSETRIELQSKEEFTVNADTTPEKKEGNLRCNSEPSLNILDLPISRISHKSDSSQIKSCTYDHRTQKAATLSTARPVGRYSTGGKLSRAHVFVSKMVIKTEKCNPCGKVIKFCKQALRCSDCRIVCHPECREQCPLPCVQITQTSIKGTKGTIADYASSTAPMIPPLIVHCVNEIESRGLKELGLYRKSGSERDIKDLKDKLLKGRSISMNRTDIHAVCGTIKEFLRSLTDSLVTRAAWKIFVDASEFEDESTRLNAIYDAVAELPQPNKETLAFLILHLQRVADADDCKMPLDNLAKIFGPTIVGYSCAEPSDSAVITQTKKQCKVMKCLLMIPSDLWQNLLSIQLPEVFYNPLPLTPECLPAPKASRLGPIYPTPDQKKNIRVGRTSLTPRKQNPINESLFLSPMMK